MRLIINPKQEPERMNYLEERREAIRDLRLTLYITAAYIGGLCVAVLLSHA